MTVEVASTQRGARLGIAARVRSLDNVEALLLAIFAAVSCWVMAVDLYQQIVNGYVWTGTDGFFITDQMQYLAWVVSASHHGLIANMFVLRGTPADYLQPAVAISGLFVALGMSPPLALLLWKPVAVLCTFFGIRVYVHHSLETTRARRVGIALGLFYGSLTFLYGKLGVIGDMYPGFLTWGYPFGLVALGAVLYALVLYDRARPTGRMSPWPPLLGALASSLHPWNGETLIVIIVVTEALRLRSDGFHWERVRTVTITCLVTGLPLVYYLLLGKTDPSWTMARVASKHAFPFWPILMVAVPIIPFAVLGYRGRSTSFWQSSVRVFPFVCLGIYFFSASGESATPVHAFQGVTVPLGVLSIQGVATTRWEQFRYRRVVGWIVLLLATVPASAWEMKIASSYMGPERHNANFIRRDEMNALNFLHADQTPGGVIATAYLGLVVPGKTERQTFVGDCLWSEPDCSLRAQLTDEMFANQLTPAAARKLVRQSGARFVLSDCNDSPKLFAQIAPLIGATFHFGCATVYQVAKPTAASGPLA